MMFSIGWRHGLVDNICDEVQKLCKSLEAKNSGVVFVSFLPFKLINMVYRCGQNVLRTIRQQSVLDYQSKEVEKKCYFKTFCLLSLSTP